MKSLRHRAGRIGFMFLLLLAGLPTGCATTAQTVALSVGGTTAAGAYSPNNEIEQIYYFGVFDPQDQVPPTIYRVRVRGQASFISATKFASGWVQAALLDSLNTNISFPKDGGAASISDADGASAIKTGRRLVLFGPEGFREAPKDHRLVIVMGTSPEAFFEAIDRSLGVVSQAMAEQRAEGLSRELFAALTLVKGEREQFDDLVRDVEADLPLPGGGTP